jgi:hypothetical protein
MSCAAHTLCCAACTGARLFASAREHEDLDRDVGSDVVLAEWPALHLEGPQGLIDDAMRIDDADVVVGVFWKRFGTPTLDAGSGTEHELRRAWRAWQERERPQVIVYFCERKTMPQDSSEAAQLQQLLSFREAMPKEQLWWRYTTVADFERVVRRGCPVARRTS